MQRRFNWQKGSGLIIALGVLAMLAIMATTFITLMRLDTRVTASYVDDLRCEMLVQGALHYFKGILRDDLNRRWRATRIRGRLCRGSGTTRTAPFPATTSGSRFPIGVSASCSPTVAGMIFDNDPSAPRGGAPAG